MTLNDHNPHHKLRLLLIGEIFQSSSVRSFKTNGLTQQNYDVVFSALQPLWIFAYSNGILIVLARPLFIPIKMRIRVRRKVALAASALFLGCCFVIYLIIEMTMLPHQEDPTSPRALHQVCLKLENGVDCHKVPQ